jgi:hypothetical protein
MRRPARVDLLPIRVNAGRRLNQGDDPHFHLGRRVRGDRYLVDYVWTASDPAVPFRPAMA